MAEPPPIIHLILADVAAREHATTLLRLAGFALRHWTEPSAFRRDPSPAAQCLLVEMGGAGLDGAAFQAQLADGDPTVPVIMATGCADLAMVVAAMRGGAVTVLPRPFHTEALLSALADALERDRAECQLRETTRELQRRWGVLSQRERQIMGLVTAGLLNKQVARRLEITEITVKIHRGNLMRKMGAHSFADLVYMAVMLRVRDREAMRYPAAARGRVALPVLSRSLPPFSPQPETTPLNLSIVPTAPPPPTLLPHSAAEAP